MLFAYPSQKATSPDIQMHVTIEKGKLVWSDQMTDVVASSIQNLPKVEYTQVERVHIASAFDWISKLFISNILRTVPVQDAQADEFEDAIAPPVFKLEGHVQDSVVFELVNSQVPYIAQVVRNTASDPLVWTIKLQGLHMKWKQTCDDDEYFIALDSIHIKNSMGIDVAVSKDDKALNLRVQCCCPVVECRRIGILPSYSIKCEAVIMVNLNCVSIARLARTVASVMALVTTDQGQQVQRKSKYYTPMSKYHITLPGILLHCSLGFNNNAALSNSSSININIESIIANTKIVSGQLIVESSIQLCTIVGKTNAKIMEAGPFQLARTSATDWQPQNCTHLHESASTADLMADKYNVNDYTLDEVPMYTCTVEIPKLHICLSQNCLNDISWLFGIWCMSVPYTANEVVDKLLFKATEYCICKWKILMPQIITTIEADTKTKFTFTIEDAAGTGTMCSCVQQFQFTCQQVSLDFFDGSNTEAMCCISIVKDTPAICATAIVRPKINANAVNSYSCITIMLLKLGKVKFKLHTVPSIQLSEMLSFAIQCATYGGELLSFQYPWSLPPTSYKCFAVKENEVHPFFCSRTEVCSLEISALEHKNAAWCTLGSKLINMEIDIFDGRRHCENCKCFDLRLNLRDLILQDKTFSYGTHSKNSYAIQFEESNSLSIEINAICRHSATPNSNTPNILVNLDRIVLVCMQQFWTLLIHYISHDVMKILLPWQLNVSERLLKYLAHHGSTLTNFGHNNLIAAQSHVGSSVPKLTVNSKDLQFFLPVSYNSFNRLHFRSKQGHISSATDSFPLISYTFSSVLPIIDTGSRRNVVSNEFNIQGQIEIVSPNVGCHGKINASNQLAHCTYTRIIALVSMIGVHIIVQSCDIQILLQIFQHNFQELPRKEFTDDPVMDICKLCHTDTWLDIQICLQNALCTIDAIPIQLGFHDLELRLAWTLYEHFLFKLCTNFVSVTTGSRESRLLVTRGNKGNCIQFSRDSAWTTCDVKLCVQHVCVYYDAPLLLKLIKFCQDCVPSDTNTISNPRLERCDVDTGLCSTVSLDFQECVLAFREEAADERIRFLFCIWSIYYFVQSGKDFASSVKMPQLLQRIKATLIGLFVSLENPSSNLKPKNSKCSPIVWTIDTQVRNATSTCQSIKLLVQPFEMKLSCDDINLLAKHFSMIEFSDHDEISRNNSNDMEFVGDFGDFRIILISNSLRDPISNISLRNISIDGSYEASNFLHRANAQFLIESQYFNHSIYRWEPLLEPANILCSASKYNSSNEIEVKIQATKDVNVNFSYAFMTRIGMELAKIGAVNSGKSYAAPFWVRNDTGQNLEVKLQVYTNLVKIASHSEYISDGTTFPLDCHEFENVDEVDTVGNDMYKKPNSTAVAAEHRLVIQLTEPNLSLSSIVIDSIGQFFVTAKKLNGTFVVVEVELQDDGSKLIAIHSNLKVENATHRPLAVSSYCRGIGTPLPHVVNREDSYYMPLHYIQKGSQVYLSPDEKVSWEKLHCSKARVTGREASIFLRPLVCDATSTKNDSVDIPVMPTWSKLIPDFPPWRCMYYTTTRTLSKPPAMRSIRVGNSIMSQDSNDKLRDNEKPTKREPKCVDIRVANMYTFTMMPLFSLRNKVPQPVAYRVLHNMSLVSEGMLEIGQVVQLFQIPNSLFVQFRLTNYSWSPLIEATYSSTQCKFILEKRKIILEGQKGRFIGISKLSKKVHLPDLELIVMSDGQHITIWSQLWIVNHSGFQLEYLPGKLPSYTDCSIPRYCQDFNVDRDKVIRNHIADLAKTQVAASRASLNVWSMQQVLSSVAVSVESATGLRNCSILAAQSPYVVAKLFREINGETVLLAEAQTPPCIGGGTCPIWSSGNKKMLLLEIPICHLSSAPVHIVLSIRSTRLGIVQRLGSCKISMDDIYRVSEKSTDSDKLEEYPLDPPQCGKVTVFTLAGWKAVKEPLSSPHQLLPTPRDAFLKGNVEASSLVEVFLPENRFQSVKVPCRPDTTASNLLSKVLHISRSSILNPENYLFYRLTKPGFASVRSPGRPESDSWWHKTPIHMNEKIGNMCKFYGLHLCHQEMIFTIRSYNSPDENDADSTELVPSASVLAISSSSGSWDTIRMRVMHQSASNWSKKLHLRQNALGNSGVPQTISFTHEHNGSDTYDTNLAVWAAYGNGIFEDSIVATIVPRYVIKNSSSSVLIVHRVGSTNSIEISPATSIPFHWQDQNVKRISIQLIGDWKVSESFSVDTVGTQYIKLRGIEHRNIYILQLQIELVGGSLIITFHDESKRWPPYRIDNCTPYRLRYFQTANLERDYDTLAPFQNTRYAWDFLDHGSQRKLQVLFMASTDTMSDALLDTAREYDLDEMKLYPAFEIQQNLPPFSDRIHEGQLSRSDDRRRWSLEYFRLLENTLYSFGNPTTYQIKTKWHLCRSCNISFVSGDKLVNADNLLTIRSKLKNSKFLADSMTSRPAISDQQVLSGTTIVDFMLFEAIAKERNHAIELCNMLIEAKFLFNAQVDPKMALFFDEADVLYTLSASETPLPRRHSSSRTLSSNSRAAELYLLSIECKDSKIYLGADSADRMAEWKMHLEFVAALNDVSCAECPCTICLGAIKVSVKVSIRADGPTKVLEFTEKKKDSKRSISEYQHSLSPNNTLSNFAGEKQVLVQFKRIGVSMVDSFPQEVAYFCFTDVSIKGESKNGSTAMSITCKDFQADNQLQNANFATILCHRQEDEEREDYIPSSFHCKHCSLQQDNQIPTLHSCCSWSHENTSQGVVPTDYYEYFTLWIKPFLSQLDEELVLLLYSIATRALTCGGVKTTTESAERACDSEVELITKSAFVDKSSVDWKTSTCLLDLNPLSGNRDSLKGANSYAPEERKVYFALLHLHPIEFELTFRSDTITNVDGDKYRASNKLSDHVESLEGNATDTFRTHLPDLDEASIKLNFLLLEHAFGSGNELGNRITKHYLRQLWKQVHRLVGSFDFLGNPVGFLDHISTGVKDFFYEPYEGIRRGSGMQFTQGIAKGTSSLVSNTVDGTFDAASKITATFGQGLAKISLDERYQYQRATARRKQVKNVREGVIQGAKEFSFGMYEGISGVMLEPYRGAIKDGAVGFVKGTVTGILGVPMKPAAGIFDFASRTSQGVRNRARKEFKSNGELVARIRKPRVFGRRRQLRSYSKSDIDAHEILGKLRNGEYKNDELYFHFVVAQSSASKAISEDAQPKKSIMYQVTFDSKEIGFHLKNVDDRMVVSEALLRSPNDANCQVNTGDILIAIANNDIDRMNLKDVQTTIRESGRPITLTLMRPPGLTCRNAASDFATNASDNDPTSIDLFEHWIIATDRRILYVNTTNFEDPQMEWMIPINYLESFSRNLSSCSIDFVAKVGINSLPLGPINSSSQWISGKHAIKYQKIFDEVMTSSLGEKVAVNQELLPKPIDHPYAMHLTKHGNYTVGKRWFMVHGSCLYHFSSETTRRLRGITPLGRITIQIEDNDKRSFIIKSTTADAMLASISLEKNEVKLRTQECLRLTASSDEDCFDWYETLRGVAGLNERGAPDNRYYGPKSARTLHLGILHSDEAVIEKILHQLTKLLNNYQL